MLSGSMDPSRSFFTTAPVGETISGQIGGDCVTPNIAIRPAATSDWYILSTNLKCSTDALWLVPSTATPGLTKFLEGTPAPPKAAITSWSGYHCVRARNASFRTTAPSWRTYAIGTISSVSFVLQKVPRNIGTSLVCSNTMPPCGCFGRCLLLVRFFRSPTTAAVAVRGSRVCT